MVRAGAIGKRVVDELTELGCDVQNGCADGEVGTAARAAFAGRTLADYYVEGKINCAYKLSTVWMKQSDGF